MNVPMTDYYPLINTAVAALENNTSAARRTVYEYARSALVRQSRNKIPPLTETELACERLALEQAILRVQAEQGRRSSRDPSRTYSSDVRPQEPTAERAPPCHAVPSNPAPGPRSQPNPSSARREAPARREPPPVARREQAVPPRPTTSGVGAREVANQPPSPAPPPRLRFPLLDRRNEEVTNHPGTLLAPPSAAPVKRGDRSRLPAAILRVLGPRKPTVAPPNERPATVPGRGLPPPHCDQPRHPPARPSEQAAPRHALMELSADGAGARVAGHSPTARNALIVGRTQAAATQPIPQALLEFEPPSATRTEGSEAAAQKIVTAVVPAATALTAVSAAGRGQAVTVQPMPPALLEFESPTAALLEAPVKPAARSVLWSVVSAVIASTAVAALFPIDMVVSGAGRVVSLRATTVVQPLETAIVRAINVREGQTVRAGELLASLDPTFSGADVSSLQANVKSFQAEVDRLAAEASGTPYQPISTDASTVLQVAIFGQRQAQYRYQLESYNQKISGLQAQLIRSEQDVKAFTDRVQIASVLESKRRELERLQVGSQMNRMIAEDQRIEMERNLTQAQGAAERARRDLQQMMAERDGFEQQWKAKISEDLTLRTRSLSDASEGLRKATLRRELVDLRADQDAVVLSVAKVSVGSVMQSGEPLITLVPTNAPLEVETRIAAADAGYVRPGQKVAIKFDTFPYVQYGKAEGTVRFISPDSFSGNQETQRGNVVTQSENYNVFFKARVAIDEINMHGVPGGFVLKPGMTVTADIQAGERTMLTYLFARVLPVGLEGMREP